MAVSFLRRPHRTRNLESWLPQLASILLTTFLLENVCEGSLLSEVKSFGAFRLDTADQCLLRDGERVQITPKAYDVLRYLVEHPGRLVTPDEMLDAVWTDTHVNPEVLRKYILEIRKALGDKPDDPQFVETVPKRGHRFVAPVSDQGTVEVLVSPTEAPSPAPLSGTAATVTAEPQAAPPIAKRVPAETTSNLWPIALLLTVLLVAGVLVTLRRPARASKLTEKDTVVLAEFANRTSDPVFDGTLRQGLSAELQQSPFLNLLSDRRIAETLSLMKKPKDTRLADDLAREVCQRTVSTATIEGSIATLGRNYVIGLRAVNCNKGDVLAEEQVTANTKEQVLTVLGEAAKKLRTRLGESLASVEKYDTPVASVTTSSLEALQAYSAGVRAMYANADYPTTISHLERAVKLDAEFAAAYELLSNAYWTQGEVQQAAENGTKAYALRERVSERERLSIEANYEWIVNGNLENARKKTEIWSATYPRDADAATYMGILSTNLGDYERSLAAFKDGLKRDPGGLWYSNLVSAYTSVNRLGEARQTAQEAIAHGFDTPWLHLNIYYVDFLENDAPAMLSEVHTQMGQAGVEDMLLFAESDTAVYSGQFAKARELTRRAIDSAAHADEKEVAASYQAQAAVREALAGNFAVAEQEAQGALANSKARDVEAMSAIGLATAGDSVLPKRLLSDLKNRYPNDTIVQSIYLPTITAAAYLHGGDAGDAIRALAPSAFCELGSGFANGNFDLYPPYLRGMAFLRARNGNAAVAEFQKIVDHPGIVVNEEIGALAHLGIGRAYAFSGDKAKARAAYQDFLKLWKDGDPDVPILKQARAEYEKLQ